MNLKKSIGRPGARSVLYERQKKALMLPIPHELTIGGIYLSPLFVAAVFGVLGANISASLLNRYRLTQYFFYPPLVLVAMAVIYTVLIGTFIFGS